MKDFSFFNPITSYDSAECVLLATDILRIERKKKGMTLEGKGKRILPGFFRRKTPQYQVLSFTAGKSDVIVSLNLSGSMPQKLS